MEAVVFDAHLLHEFEAGINFGFGIAHWVFFFIDSPGLVHGVAAEHVGTGSAEVVPPSHSEWHPFFHWFSKNDAVGIVVLESEWFS